MRERQTFMTDVPPERCDTKVWSGECRSDKATGENTYLCTVCGTIVDLNHEMHSAR